MSDLTKKDIEDCIKHPDVSLVEAAAEPAKTTQTLVERLRSFPKFLSPSGSLVCQKAADEIEALTSRVAALERDAHEIAAKMLDEQAAHVAENAEALRLWAGMEHEARARELAGLYLSECASCIRMDKRLAAIDRALALRATEPDAKP